MLDEQRRREKGKEGEEEGEGKDEKTLKITTAVHALSFRWLGTTNGFEKFLQPPANFETQRQIFENWCRENINFSNLES